METQLEAALAGRVTEAMVQVAGDEHCTPEDIRDRVARGTVVICANVNHKALRPAGVGEGLRV